MIYQKEIVLDSVKRSHWIDITAVIQNIVTQSDIGAGVLTISSLHTTGAVTINENGDPHVELDIFSKLNKIIPKDELFYKHLEGNSDSHLKTSLIGNSQQVQINEGRLILGTWQSIYFCEFDGPRVGRTLAITILGE